MKKFNLVSGLLIILSTAGVFAQQDIVDMFSRRAHFLDSKRIPYRLFVPANYDSTKQYPLVLTLHGSGERGIDNENQISNYRIATAWADPANQAVYPCIVVSPQAPQQSSWEDHIEILSDLLDSLEREFSVDINRLYITGLSMGGFGSWAMVEQFPTRFAAAIPMSGGGNPNSVPSYAHLPTWAFHGENDEVVPADLSRNMISAIENTGESAFYTHCRNGGCSGLSMPEIQQLIDDNEFVFYTEYRGGGHIIWDESYDYPLLFPWVFKQYRIDLDAVFFRYPTNHRRLFASEAITWTVDNPEDSVEIRYSRDAGENWQTISPFSQNNGRFLWNTKALDDAAFGQLRIFLKNQDGFIYGRQKSTFFTIDNGQNGAPFVRILNREFAPEQQQIDLELLIGDPEQGELNVMLFYSINTGDSFQQFDSYTTLSDTISQFRTVDLTALPNSNEAMFKVIVDDGNTFSETVSPTFMKRNMRPADLTAAHASGPSAAQVSIFVVDPSQLTGDRYQISFNDSAAANTQYSVRNIDTGANILENISHEFDGIVESPQFDGIRIAIKDVDPIEVDAGMSGWTAGSPSVEITGSFIETYQAGFERLDCVRLPSDYTITFFDEIVDTSLSLLGAPPKPMKFFVQKVAAAEPSGVIFVDGNNDQFISPGDRIIIIETDENDAPFCTWTLTGGGTNDTPPLAGDIYTLVLLKALSSDDIYEFSGTLTGISENATDALPEHFSLAQNYPNPFNPTTTINFQLPETSITKLIVYNILGEEVRTLLSERMKAGKHSIQWDGNNSFGNPAASGIYIYRLSIISPGSISANAVFSRTMVLLK